MNNKNITKIKIIHELPRWFNIKNYNLALEFDAKRWYEQLFIRYFLYRIGFEGNNHSDILDVIRKKPILEISEDARFEIIMRYSTSKLHGKIRSDIHLSTPSELILHSKGTSPQQFKYAINYLTQNHLNPTIPSEPFIDEPITCVSEATLMDNVTVSFNPNLPERMLINQFQNLLNKIKSEQSSEKRHQKYDYQRWHSYGILPYLDLDIWAKQNNKSITMPVLTEAIYADSERSEEDMKKTTIPTAEMIMTDTALIKLAAQIELEEANTLLNM